MTRIEPSGTQPFSEGSHLSSLTLSFFYARRHPFVL
jgi:hypothetical protein